MLKLYSHMCCVKLPEDPSPKVIIALMPRTSQHRPLRPPALKNFFQSNLDFKGFHKVQRITARGTSGIFAFGEKNPDATIKI